MYKICFKVACLIRMNFWESLSSTFHLLIPTKTFKVSLSPIEKTMSSWTYCKIAELAFIEIQPQIFCN